ncbi:ABC transporter permease [Fibrella forsythiae]|uniref:ABC transporter permease n=1 Tax=Fibrella forsythiae TaxID=2817061 RepID=A0ABS3JE26_9BACT|nr:FtsX-like permease family protein [Fibrella forsythiae]MBO0948243.1 ABC transporter permease [Fibrella forsythiae]
MLRSYLTLAIRQLWRNRLYTSLNVLGLAIGLSACWVIFQLVSFEFSFDRNHPNGDRLYRVVSRLDIDGKETGHVGVPKPLAGAIQTKAAGVELTVPFQKLYESSVDVAAAVPTAKPVRIDAVGHVCRTTTDYFKLVPYTWLAGDPANALTEPGRVVLTQSRVQQYFPRLTPRQAIGQQLTYYGFNDTTRTVVAGVIADLTYPTDFDGKEFIALVGDKTYSDPEEWGSINSDNWLYVLLQPNVKVASLNEQVTRLTRANAAPLFRKWGVSDMNQKVVFQPLADIHFNPDYEGRADKKRLLSLMGLALFVLTLAVVNYVNLSTAQVPQRAREIGVRKALGSSRAALMSQFLGETTLVTALALLVAWPLSGLFMQSFHDQIPEGTIDYLNVGQLVLFLLALLLLVSALAGLYPAWLITRLQAAKVLRSGKNGMLAGHSGRITLRKSLIVFQFIIAHVFIVGAIIVGQQLRFAFTKELGFARQAVVLVKAPMKYVWNVNSPLRTRHLPLREAYRELPGVAAVSLGDAPLTGSYSTGEARIKGRKGQEILASIQRKHIDTTWLNLYAMKLLAGRNLYPSDTAREWVINETALKTFDLGTPQQAIGKVLYEGKKPYPVVGVVRDFNTLGISRKINPVALMTETRTNNTFNIKLASTNPADWPGTLAAMEQAWKKAYPDDAFKYEFYDDSMQHLYQEERTLSRIVNLATAVAILISCLGLFGLATLTAFQRTKEIGIRKVLGASVASVVALLSREFVGLVGIAIVVATPLAGWGMKQWLNNYAYQIDLTWWLFAGAAALALIIALATVAFQSIRAAIANPVDSLRSE